MANTGLSEEQIETIRELIAENPEASDKSLAATAGVGHATIWRIRNGVGKYAAKKHSNGRKVREVPGYKAISEALKHDLIEANREIRSLRARIAELESPVKIAPTPSKLNGGVAVNGWTVKPSTAPTHAPDDELDDFMAFREFKRRQQQRGGVIK